MWLILCSFALVVGITFFQTTQGLFSAMIMAVLSILCAAIAFNFYEPLSAALAGNMPGYSDGIALVVIFVAGLLTLRILFDKFVGGNVVLGVWIDRIGGAAVGLFTGLVCTGVLMVAVQLLPWHHDVLGGYRPFDDSLRRVRSLPPFYPDQFVIGMVSMFADGSLSADPQKRFADTHDDLLRTAAAARNTAYDTVGNPLNGSVVAMPNQLKISGVFEPADDANFTKMVEQVPQDAFRNKLSRIVIVRVTLDENARAQDDDTNIRLPATHFRLVTRDAKSVYPVAYLTQKQVEIPPATAATQPDKPAAAPKPAPGPATAAATTPPPPPKPAPKKMRTDWQLHAAPVDGEIPQVGKLVVVRPWTTEHKEGEAAPSKQISIDWVFRLANDDQPAFIEFRRIARAEPGAIKKGMPPHTDALTRDPK